MFVRFDCDQFEAFKRSEGLMRTSCMNFCLLLTLEACLTKERMSRWTNCFAIFICLLLATIGVLVVVNTFGVYKNTGYQKQQAPRYRNIPSSPETLNDINPHSKVYIYYYNSPEWMFKDPFKQCENKCEFSTNLSSSKAVIFHGPSLSGLPPERVPGQAWILHGIESPVHYRMNKNQFKKWAWSFNWTMTYRRDSDILTMYGTLKFRDTKVDMDYVKKLWKEKTGDVVMLTSNCHAPSKRMKYVNKLQRFIPVHVYGKCGNYSCAKSEFKMCNAMLKRKYKLFLSFENSLCRDYVTEKAFNNFAHDPLLMIPITRGDRSVYPLVLPPGSYIDTHSFKDVRDMSYHVHNVMNNETLYLSYLQKSSRYFYTLYPLDPFCELCRRLHHVSLFNHVYDDIYNWLHLDAHTYRACIEPTDI